MQFEDAILKKIEYLRVKMAEIVHDKGMTSKESVEISQQIDCLLNRYNKRKKQR